MIGLLWLLACAHKVPEQVPSPPPAPAEPPAAWTAEATRQGDDWLVHYRFPEPRSAVLFDTAHGEYRTNSWTVGDGASLENHGGLDGLFFDSPASEVTLTITPPEGVTEGTPAFVNFSDGSSAFYAGQLALLTVENREEAVALDGNLRAWKGTQPELQVSFTGDGPWIGPEGAADRIDEIAQFGRGPYVYKGSLVALDGRVILDPGLPDWIGTTFAERLSTMEKEIAREWQQQVPPAQALLAWAGGGPTLNRGRAEGRQLALVVQGDAYLEETPEIVRTLTWFFAHELQHHHQFHERGAAPTWITEGFADTLATGVLVRQGLYDVPDLERRYWSVSRECARLLTGHTLETSRGRVAYVCGDLAGLAAMALSRDHDLPASWKAARSRAGGQFEGDDLYAVLEAGGADPVGVAGLRQFVTEPHENTDEAVRALLQAVGLAPVYREGSLSSLDFPFPRYSAGRTR